MGRTKWGGAFLVPSSPGRKKAAYARTANSATSAPTPGRRPGWSGVGPGQIAVVVQQRGFGRLVWVCPILRSLRRRKQGSRKTMAVGFLFAAIRGCRRLKKEA